MATALKRPEPGFVVAESCPGCGGEVELEQDFFVTSCRHCGSILRVLVPETPQAYLTIPRVNAAQARAALDRYLKEHDLPLTSSTVTVRRILYPYWRIDALAVKVRITVESAPADRDDDAFSAPEPETWSKRTVALTPYSVTVAAGASGDVIPTTVGLRADYLKLKPFDSDNLPEGYDVCPVENEWADALERARSSARATGLISETTSGENRTDLVYPRASVVYFPYLMVASSRAGQLRAIIDAVTGRVVGHSNHPVDGELPATLPDAASRFGRLGLEFHRCISCGGELPANPSYVYRCGNCDKFTLLGPVQGTAITWAEHSPEDLLVPFWLIRNDGTTIGKMIPAFRIANAEALFRLSRRMTTAASRLSVGSNLCADVRAGAVNIAPGEAMALADVMAYRAALENNERALFVPSAPPLAPPSLLYVPFRAEEYFYVDTALRAVTFERALLRESD